jgi:hypothetical protein
MITVFYCEDWCVRSSDEYGMLIAKLLNEQSKKSVKYTSKEELLMCRINNEDD